MKTPQAFPGIEQVQRMGYATQDTVPYAGLTKREYFAAKAMQAYLIAAQGNTPDPEETAGDAYFMADAMLKAGQQ